MMINKVTPSFLLSRIIISLAVIIIIATTTSNNDGVLAWSPSWTPTEFSSEFPSGVKFGANPQTSKCCVRVGANIWCFTDGFRESRAKAIKFSLNPLDYADDFTLDSDDIFRLSKCTFALYNAAKQRATVGFQYDYEVDEVTDLAVYVFDTSVDPPQVVSAQPANPGYDWPHYVMDCAVDAHSSYKAVLLDSGAIIASINDGEEVRKINLPTTPMGFANCEYIELSFNAWQPWVYGAFMKGGVSSNISYWITSDGLYKYDGDEEMQTGNITNNVNASEPAYAAEGPAGTFHIIHKYVDYLGVGPPYPFQHYISGVNVDTMSVTAQQAVSQKLVAFVGKDTGSDKLYSCIRDPAWKVVEYTLSNLALPPTEVDVTGNSPADPGAVLPGSIFFKDAQLPNIVAMFDQATKELVMVTVPQLNSGPASDLDLPSLAIEWDTGLMQRNAHYVLRAGAQAVAGSAVGSGSFFAVLGSIPSTVVMFSAEDLSTLQDEYQANMLESTVLGDSISDTKDSIMAFDADKSHLYVTGTTASLNEEPTWIIRFDTSATSLNKVGTLLLGAEKLQGCLVLKTSDPSQRMLYVVGSTGKDSIYVVPINITGPNMVVADTNGDGNGNDMLDNITLPSVVGGTVVSAKLDATENYLLIATEYVAMVKVKLNPLSYDSVAYYGAAGAKSLAVDPYGFVGIGYANPGRYEYVRADTGESLIGQQQIPGNLNFNLLRRTEDDNIFGLSLSQTKGGPGGGPGQVQSQLYTIKLDLVTEDDPQQVQITSPQNLNNLPNPVTMSTTNGFTFALGRQNRYSLGPPEPKLIIYRSGSKTNYDQKRKLVSNSKTGELYLPAGAKPMSRDAAVAKCAESPGNFLAPLNDETEIAAIRGLFDQDGVWVAGKWDDPQWKWIWPGVNGAPPDKYWAAKFPTWPRVSAACVYQRQGKLFNGDCDLLFLPVCVRPYPAVDRDLIYSSIPTQLWISMYSQPRKSDIFPKAGGVFGLRRVDFVDNFFTCYNSPWSGKPFRECGAAWDTQIFGQPQDVQLVQQNLLFVSTKTSLYEVDLVLGRQNLIRQYTWFRRPMTMLYRFNTTVIYGKTRTDFYAVFGNGKRVNTATLTDDDACDVVQLILKQKKMICLTKTKVVLYDLAFDKKNLRLVFSNKQVVFETFPLVQTYATKFFLGDPGQKPPALQGDLKMSIFADLVVQDVAYNASADASHLCELVGRDSPGATALPGLSKSLYTSLSARSGDDGLCGYGWWKNCTRIQFPLLRKGTELDCSSGTTSSKLPPVPSGTLSWLQLLLSKVGARNGQIALRFKNDPYIDTRPWNAPEEDFEATITALEDGVVAIALTAVNFPCFTRASDFSTYCMSTIDTCTVGQWMPPGRSDCFDTFSFGGVSFDENCDVIRYCNATIMTSFNILDPSFKQQTDLVDNAQTFSGELESMLQFNLTGEEYSYMSTFDNRLGVFQDFGNASKITIDRSTSWLSEDSPVRSFQLQHAKIATRQTFATAATVMDDDTTHFWKRSLTVVTKDENPPLHYAIVVESNNAAEFDNVLYCGVKATGKLLFAPFDATPDTSVPKFVVDGVPPWNLPGIYQVYYGKWQNQTIVHSQSNFNPATGEFSVLVNCSVTQEANLFLDFADGATVAIPFYVIGDQIGQNSDAGDPPDIKFYPALPIWLPWATTTSFASWPSDIAGVSAETTISGISAQLALATGPGIPYITIEARAAAGSFVASNHCPPALGTATTYSDATKTVVQISMSSVGNFQQIMDQCVGFYPSPAAVYRDILTYYLLTMNVTYSSLTSQLALPINLVQRNIGPQVVPQPSGQCNVTIVVLHETVAVFGQIFTHPLGVNMDIEPKVTYKTPGGVEQAIWIECNKTGWCEVEFDKVAETINFELTASDGYFYASTFCGVYGKFVKLDVNVIPPMFTVHSGRAFTYTIPDTLFITSKSEPAYSITGVTENNNGLKQALPTGVSFQSPSLLVGACPDVKLYNFTVSAKNVFGSANGYLLFNSTNSAPVTAANFTSNQRALVAFEEKISLNSLVTDAESDALKFDIMDAGLLPSWLATSISPGTITTSPQELLLQGTPTADYNGKTVTLKIKCNDAWNATYTYVNIVIKLEHLTSIPPGPTGPPRVTEHPGTPFIISVNMSSFFSITTTWDFHFSSTISSDVSISKLEFTNPSGGTDVGYISGTLDGTPDEALGVHNITITAINPFQTAKAHILIAGVNNAPNRTARADNLTNFGTRPIDLGTFHAAHKMSITVPVSNFFSDRDFDPINFGVVTNASSNWIRSLISFAPGEYSLTAQTMAIVGLIPVTEVGRSVQFGLECDDRWNSSVIQLYINIPPSQPPVLVKPLPNYTVVPGESVSGSLLLSEYFSSPDGDLLEESVQITDGGSFTTAVLSGQTGHKSLKVGGSPSVVADDVGVVEVSVDNPFKQTKTSKIFIYVRMTDWQKIQETISLASSILGSVLGVWGFVAYYPIIVGIIKGSKVVIECPLSRQKPKYNFPEGTEDVKVLIRENKYNCLKCTNHFIWDMMTLKPPPRVGPPCYIKVYDKHVGLRLDIDWIKEDPPDDAVVQFFSGSGILIQEFECVFHSVMGLGAAGSADGHVSVDLDPNMSINEPSKVGERMTVPGQQSGGVGHAQPLLASAGAAPMVSAPVEMSPMSGGGYTEPAPPPPPPPPPQRVDSAFGKMMPEPSPFEDDDML